MERGSLVIKEIAWRVRGSQTPKRSHEETIGDTSPSVASSVLSRPSYYSLHSSHSGSLSFPLLHSLTPSSSLSSSLVQSPACICSARLFCTIIRSELHLQLVCLPCFSSSHETTIPVPSRWKQIQEVFGYDVYGIPSGGVTVVGPKAGILGILQAPLRLWTWVRHEISCLAPLTLTSGATGDTFSSGNEERGENYRAGERQPDMEKERECQRDRDPVGW